jgi:DNA polymerase III sliding clamp (beta) subunit (PCNA family)
MTDRLVFQCFKENLLTALNTIYPAISAKDSIATYRCYNLQIVDNALMIYGMNREFSISSLVSGRITANDGETISVDANLLRGAINSIADNDTVYIKVTDTRMLIQGTRRQYKLNCLEYGSIPLPELPDNFLGTLEQGTNGVFRGFYAGDDNGNLSAMRLDVKEGSLTVSATNQYRFASIGSPMITINPEPICLALPKKSGNTILKLFRDEAIEVYANDRVIGFAGPTATLISALMVFIPPNLARDLKYEWAGSMKVPVKELKTMAETAIMLLPESRCGKLIFNFSTPSVTVGTSEQQQGSGVAEVIGENANLYSGEPSKTAMINMKYLIDALDSVTPDAIEIMVAKDIPIVGIRPEFSTNELHVFMPMVTR